MPHATGGSTPQLVLGADLSTDSLKWIVVNVATGEVVAQNSFAFLKAFGEFFGLRKGGFLELGDGAVRIPYGLFPAAIHTMLGQVTEALGDDRQYLRRIVVSVQQHGKVAWRKGRRLDQLAGLNHMDLLGQFDGLFANDYATSWMDTSSAPDCTRLEELQPPDWWAQLTGSSPGQSLRFLGPQIARSARLTNTHDNTSMYTVLASLVGSILTGRKAGIGMDEASATLLMDLASGTWAEAQLQGYFPKGTFDKLPTILSPGANLGRLWSHHVRLHGLPETCEVLLGLGDNIAIQLTMAGEDGAFGVSLGSSGTGYAERSTPGWDPQHRCHVLRSAAGKFLVLSCTAFCGKAANDVREMAGLEWTDFDRLVAQPQWDDSEALVLPGKGGNFTFRNVRPASTDVAAAVTRGIVGVVRTQSMSLVPSPPAVVLTGGFASKPVAQVVADVFQAPVHLSGKVNRVALGSCILGVASVTGEPLPAAAARLAPKAERIEPDLSRAEFYASMIDSMSQQ